MGFVPSPPDRPASSPFSVALCIDEDALERLGPAVRHLAVGLVDQAIPLRLIGDDDRLDDLALGPVQVTRHEPLVWPFARVRTRRLIDALAAQPPTLVHALAAGSYQPAAALAEAYEADLLLQVTSAADCEAVRDIRRSDVARFVVPSEALQRALERQLSVAHDQITRIAPGVLTAGQVSCFAQPGRDPTLVCLSPFERYAAVDRLLEAVYRVRVRNLRLMVFLLGEGPEEFALRAIVRRRKLTDTVVFASAQGDSESILRAADLFVRPAVGEALDVADLMAMAVGLCFVSCGNGAVDYIRPDETAILCEPTVESLAAALTRALTDQAFARSIASAGQEYVRTHHSVSRMAELTAELYRRVALATATIPIPE